MSDPKTTFGNPTSKEYDPTTLTVYAVDTLQVFVALELEIRRVGSAKALAEELGISQQYLSDVRKRRRAIPGVVLNRLGLVTVTLYAEPPTDERCER